MLLIVFRQFLLIISLPFNYHCINIHVRRIVRRRLWILAAPHCIRRCSCFFADVLFFVLDLLIVIVTNISPLYTRAFSSLIYSVRCHLLRIMIWVFWIFMWMLGYSPWRYICFFLALIKIISIGNLWIYCFGAFFSYFNHAYVNWIGKCLGLFIFINIIIIDNLSSILRTLIFKLD